MKVLIVEDDVAIFELVKQKLEQWAFEVVGVTDFHRILERFQETNPQVVLLDIQLPAFDGFHWCREIRAISKVPIVFLSSRDHPLDMVMAMQMGADDYVQKPFNGDVLVAKIQALVRRTYDYSDEQSDLIEWNGSLLDLKKGTIRKNEIEIDLTKNEFFILVALIQSKDAILTRDELIRKLWDDERFVNDNTLTVNMNRLRQKLVDIELDDCIVTKKGLGYMAVTK